MGISMTKQRRCVKEFKAEAVRLVQTNARTQRQVVDDLGVGLSTLVRWIGRRRDRLIEEPFASRTFVMSSWLIGFIASAALAEIAGNELIAATEVPATTIAIYD
jgi:transposase-like protein